MTKGDKSLVKITHEHGPSGFVFFAAFIGAAVYFVQHSQGFWGFIVAVLQAIVWPGFVVYHVLDLLNA